MVYILPPGIAENKFRINEKTGLIVTNGPLDREQREQYILTGDSSDFCYVYSMRRMFTIKKFNTPLRNFS